MKPSERRRTKVEGVLLLLLLVGVDVVLVFLIAGSIHDGLLSRESRSWPTAPGLVTSARFATSRGARGAMNCWPEIHYIYAVGGTRYAGSRVAFRGGYGFAEAAGLVARYPPSTPVAVRYRPGDPATAVLEPGSWDGPRYLGLYVPLTLVVIVCTGLFAWGLRAVLRTARR